MATTDRSRVEAARRDLANQRRTLIAKLYQFEQATLALREAKRKFEPDSEDLAATQAAFDAADGAFRQARSDETARLAALQLELATWLPDGTTPEEDVSRLVGTEPIVLFPVRLETRFDGAFLKVRVYPDEIFLNTHETALTVAEYDAAKLYYTQLNEVGNEKVLWRDIVARFGVERSAYILRQMLPVFGEAGLTQTSSYHLSSSTCGGTLIGGGKEKLFFPQDIQLRSANWTRPGEAILPDRWLVVTYHDGVPRVTAGSRIIEPLAMTADPKLEESDLVDVEGSYKIDENLLWSVNFDRAVQVGMGISVPLQGTEAVDGFDRVIVVGVKSSVNELDTSRLVEKLFDAHHYTRGMAILRQGTPTNNTEGHPSPYPPRENAGEKSFINERQRAPLDREFSHHCLPFGSNGHALATALGVPSGVFANIDRAYLTDTLDARAMNRAMWPGTVGYYTQHMLGPSIFNAAQIAAARSYFGQFVLARGPAPAFRIGSVPYGVLPVASLRSWQTRSFGDADDTQLLSVETALVKPLQTLLETWLDGAGRVPRIRAGQSNPDLDVATVLSTCASSREFRVRYGYTAPVQWLFFHFFGWDYREIVDRLDQETQATLGRIGFPLWRPPIGRTVFFPLQPLFNGDIVAPELSEDSAMPGLNFITGILNATAAHLNQDVVDGKPAGASLLYQMLRHSTMAEYLRVGAVSASFDWLEFFIFNVPSLIGLIQHIVPAALAVNNAVLRSGASEQLTALSQLAFQTSAELERMFTETLDLVSHRLDAWVSSLPTRRLDDMRRSQVASRLMPRGDFMGGYGWLEDVRPRFHPTEVVPGVGTVEAQLGNGGFVHAPSMTHASAAAILRNGHLSFRNENPAAYGIDLSSQRVRSGRWLFEGVRNGQPVGALLGYQLERGLHEGHPGVPDLDQLRFTLRRLFPLVANKAGNDSTEPAEAIAARNVVDGSLLLRAHHAGALVWGSGGLPANGSSQKTALLDEIEKLDRMYDAAADLLTAEAVFQLARGNIDAAVPTINNVVEGNQPPESIITRGARGGSGLSHRVALVFPSNAGPALPNGWPAETPRAKAEPVLDKWVGQLVGAQGLGLDTDVSAKLSYFDGAGVVIPVGGQPSVTVRLAELGLHPIDLLALAEVVAKPNQGSILDQRIIAVALADPARQPGSPVATYKLDYDVTAGRSFPEVLEVLGVAAAMLGAGRALALTDLVSPAEAGEASQEEEAEPIGGANAVAFYDRGQEARRDLEEARDAFEGATGAALRTALIEATGILPMSAFPDARVDDAALSEVAAAALKELNRRFASLPAAIIPPAAVPTRPSAELLEHGRLTIEGVFGPEFRALPDLDPPRAPEIQQSLDARDALTDGDDAAPDRYLQQIVRTRDRLGRWRKLNLYARALGFARPRVDVVQLPHVPGEKWLGVGFDVPDDAELDPQRIRNIPEEGRTAALLLNYASSLDATVPWTGLVIDDWVEVIPNQVEETGIAMHYDGPQAQAPQAVLVATPSKGSGNWSFDDLLGSLEQTMDLMHVRAVSNEQLDMGQTLPMAVIPSNESPSFTLSTIFQALFLGVDTVGINDG